MRFCRIVIFPTKHSAATAAVFGRGSAPAKLGAARSICTDAVSAIAAATCACACAWAGWADTATAAPSSWGQKDG